MAYLRLPDGKWIALDHHHEPRGQIYLINSNGRNMHMVAAGHYETLCQRGRATGPPFIFASNRAGSWQVWRRELATRREAQVTTTTALQRLNRDNAKTLYYSRFEGGGIWSMPVGGGEEQRVTDALHKFYWGHFAVTDAGIYLLDSDAAPKADHHVLQLPNTPGLHRCSS